MEFNRQSIRTIIFLISFGVIASWGLFRPAAILSVFQVLLSILAPFALGLSVAFIVNLLLRPVERVWDWVLGRKVGRWLNAVKRPVCILFSTLIITTILFVLLFIVLPEVVGTIVLIVDMLPQYAAQLGTRWTQLAENLQTYGVVLPQFDVNTEEMGPMVSSWLSENGATFLGKTLGFTTSIFASVVTVIIGLVFSVYVLAQKEQLGKQTKKILHAFLPNEKANGIVEVAELAHEVFTKFVTGQFTDALIIGVLCYIGMRVLAMPHAGAISVLVAVTTIVPIVGVLFGTAVGALLILVVDPMKVSVKRSTPSRGMLRSVSVMGCVGCLR